MIENAIEMISSTASPLWGASEGSTKNLIFLCNPYVQICLFNNQGPYNEYFALITQWVLSVWSLYYQGYIFYYGVWDGAIYTDNIFPLIHISNFGWHYVIWIVQTLFIMVPNLLVAFAGLLANITQGPQILRKAFNVSVNINTYTFVFA